jgi:hypothetical protein
VIRKKYDDKARLFFTDTDSLCYCIHTVDMYKDMAEMSHHFDTSDYDPNQFLYSTVYKKVLGRMKDECSGTPPIEFVGLRSEMYSLLTNENDGDSKKTAKGVKRSFVKKNVRHSMYLHTLRNRKSTHAQFVNFRSKSHKLQTVNFARVCLSAYDDKRWVCEDGVHTLAYGHYKLL